ncbi:MAG: hypothetical protein ACR2PZ_08520 [Pseudomonadales bacterium]
MLCLLGCGSKPLAPAPPQQFDLSGTWLLQADLSDAPPGQRQLETLPPPIPGASRSRERRKPGGGLAFVAHDFPVLVARRMVIEQNADSMGIEYDRGAYRDISWGERTRGLWTVTTGWDDEGQLVVRSKAKDADAVETMTLSTNGQSLTVHLEIEAGQQDVDVRRVFSKAP